MMGEAGGMRDGELHTGRTASSPAHAHERTVVSPHQARRAIPRERVCAEEERRDRHAGVYVGARGAAGEGANGEEGNETGRGNEAGERRWRRRSGGEV